jgi:hypothetical protein
MSQSYRVIDMSEKGKRKGIPWMGFERNIAPAVEDPSMMKSWSKQFEK